MALKLNTNIDAMITQASLTISGQKKSTEIQRLGTGFRINTAKDDAAGLAISDGMASQVRGLTQARRNAADGISLAQTTEGALSGTTAQLQRMRELIVAAQNPEQSQNLAATQEEISLCMAEITRLSTQTSFDDIAEPKMDTTTLGVDTLDVSSAAATQDNLVRIDSAIDQVNSLRATLGLVDDVETTAFASANVLQQAGVAVLAQANQQPQQILKLLPE